EDPLGGWSAPERLELCLHRHAAGGCDPRRRQAPARDRGTWEHSAPITAAAGDSPGDTATVKMIAEYLEHALQFERMAQDETDPELKEARVGQAKAYRKLAAERATRLGLPQPPERE